MNNDYLVDNLVEKGVLKSSKVIDSFIKVSRAEFLRPQHIKLAHEDHPFPIGYGQTNSQPSTVAFMLELLSPQPGERILDVGSGSGWTTALLAEIVGDSGYVFGMERIPELVDFGKENLAKFNFNNAEILQAEESVLGLPSKMPFDKILVSAASDNFPESLVSQLKVGGVMVVPVRSSIYRIVKVSEKDMKTEEYRGFAFVPLL